MILLTTLWLLFHVSTTPVVSFLPATTTVTSRNKNHRRSSFSSQSYWRAPSPFGVATSPVEEISAAAAKNDTRSSSNDSDSGSSESASPPAQSTGTSGGRGSSRRKRSEQIYQLNQELNGLVEQKLQSATNRDDAIRWAVNIEDRWRKNAECGGADVVTFNIVLKAWSKVTHKLVDWHNLAFLNLEQQKQQQRPPPTTTTNDAQQDYGPPICTARDAAQHAQDLLLSQVSAAAAVASSREQDDTTTTILVDTMSYNLVMEGWSKTRDPNALKQVEKLLKQIPKPDTFSYHAYVEAIAHSKKVPNNSDGNGNSNDRIEKLNAVLSEMESNDNVRVSVRTYNSLLHAYSRGGLEASGRDKNQSMMYAKYAEGMLNKLKRTYAETNDILDRPDILTYTTVMECFARCGTVHSARKAEQLFAELKDETELRPSAYTYSTLIKAWSGYNPERAEELLEEMLENLSTAQANSIVFTAVIKAWARSKSDQKSVKVLQLLQRMQALSKENPSIAPTILSYNTAIDACSRVRGEQHHTAALRIAFAIFKAIEKSSKPNHVTYANLLKCCAYLMPPSDERDEVVRAVFAKAVKAGQVDMSVLKNLKKSCNTGLLDELLSKGMTSTHEGMYDFGRIPYAWSCHVQE